MLMFLYANSPVHFGAGVSLGAVDLPVQRERHTGYPMAQGSGLKGAIRHHVAGRATGDEREASQWVFGPDGEDRQASAHAGAVAFGDGRLLLFPVRSLVGTFAYCTSVVALGRLRRDAELLGAGIDWAVPSTPPDGTAWVTGQDALASGKVVLEDFDLKGEVSEDLRKVAAWIGACALPVAPAFEHFRKRIETHLVVLNDDLFAHLTRLATVVEPHVKIDDDTGTASGSAFFYAEHLPPDSLMWSLVGVGRPHVRRNGDDGADLARLGIADAGGVGRWLRERLDGKPLQVGAEATTGRGLVHVRLVTEGQP
ncbi:MAG: type III-B CRISPR module RAMP protein Cmr4 [Candidatus Rokubacteria bacterium]|nr:type III-B CRISPR module RAMP protein Cmr4 [Candidatus Rokubacteria bacterium]